MPYHRRIWNADIHRKYVREGRGRGWGDGYTPWIRIQDFASRGVVSRVKGITTGRVHHLMSNNELAYFYILDWSDNVTDIREQYPLSDLESAVKIAAQAGIRYPTDRTSGYPYVLTCDFMITTSDGSKARTIKASSELGDSRVIEKLEIERRYWLEQGVDWKIVTEHEISYQKAKNIEWLYTALRFDVAEPISIPQIRMRDMLRQLLKIKSYSIREAALMVEREFVLAEGMGLQLFKQLVLNKEITLNLNNPLDLSAGVVTE